MLLCDAKGRLKKSPTYVGLDVSEKVEGEGGVGGGAGGRIWVKCCIRQGTQKKGGADGLERHSDIEAQSHASYL